MLSHAVGELMDLMNRGALSEGLVSGAVVLAYFGLEWACHLLLYSRRRQRTRSPRERHRLIGMAARRGLDMAVVGVATLLTVLVTAQRLDTVSLVSSVTAVGAMLGVCFLSSIGILFLLVWFDEDTLVRGVILPNVLGGAVFFSCLCLEGAIV